ncbi:hypothetical protein V6N13_122242 [Hibiscus sabdariffa]|uniref:Yippee domain-containing protein n=1 Tax=Hibiscus sabdariffa TaxID=183260 RepID=A0ABR2NQE0_9ROSI
MSSVPPDRVRFPLDHRHRIYKCASCRNHILSAARNTSPTPIPRNHPNYAARVQDITSDGEMVNGVVCNAGGLVNVLFDSIRNRRVLYRMPAVGVFCDVCGVRVGDQLIVRHRVYRWPGLEISVRIGPLLLDPDSMIFWDGRMSVWADNNEPADEEDEE